MNEAFSVILNIRCELKNFSIQRAKIVFTWKIFLLHRTASNRGKCFYGFGVIVS